MTPAIPPFVTVADQAAPNRLDDAGFHRAASPTRGQIMLWRECGDVVKFGPHPNLPGLLIAEITVEDLPYILAIVEAGFAALESSLN